MSGSPVEVSGITPAAHFPPCPSGHPHTQFCETDKLYIPRPHSRIRDVVEVCVDVSICSTHEICTPIGKKLVIEGEKQIKVKFIAKDRRSSIRIACFNIPFCTFIVLGDSKQERVKVAAAVEHVAVKFLGCRRLAVTSVIFICTEFKPDCGHDDAHKPCNSCDGCNWPQIIRADQRHYCGI